MLTIDFDDIHTEKKQSLLDDKMTAVAAELSKIPNSTPPVSRCPICDSDVEFYARKFGFTMSRCTSRGLTFCNPYPNEAQLDVYYNSEMKEFEDEFFRDSFDKRLQIFAPRVDLIRRHKPQGRLLEIGAAVGIFLTALQKSDTPYAVTVCDRSRPACEKLVTRFPGFEVHCGTASELHMPQPFDVIAMWDTIEHVVNLKGMLANVRRLLNNGGVFIFSTPNTRSFEWIVADTRHVQLLPPGHVNLLNPSCIALLLASCGFSIVEQHTLNAWLDITYIRKMLALGKIDPARIGVFLAQSLNDERFCETLAAYLVEARMAGNVVIVARRDSGAKS